MRLDLIEKKFYLYLDLYADAIYALKLRSNSMLGKNRIINTKYYYLKKIRDSLQIKRQRSESSCY